MKSSATKNCGIGTKHTKTQLTNTIDMHSIKPFHIIYKKEWVATLGQILKVFIPVSKPQIQKWVPEKQDVLDELQRLNSIIELPTLLKFIIP